MVPVFQNFGQALIDYWQNQIDDHGGKMVTLDVHNDLTRVTLDIICKCAFNYDCNSLADENNEVSVAFTKVLGGFHLR